MLTMALIWLSVAAQGQETRVSGTFTFIQGEVLVKKDVESTWTRAAFDMPVYRGYKVKVSLYSRAEITLRDRSVIRLRENTEIDTSDLVLVQAGGEEPSSVKLLLGQVWAKVKRGGAGASSFEIATPTVVASVSGTTYRVNYEADGAAQIKVYDGKVSVFKPAPEGTASASGAIGRPSRVPRPAEEIQRPVQRVSRAEWERIVGAMQQITIAPDGSFSEPKDFSASDADEQDEWVRWNESRDASLGD